MSWQKEEVLRDLQVYLWIKKKKKDLKYSICMVKVMGWQQVMGIEMRCCLYAWNKFITIILIMKSQAWAQRWASHCARPCAYIELLVHGSFKHLNIIRIQCLSLSFIECQQCYRVLGILKGGKQAEDHFEPKLRGALISREQSWIWVHIAWPSAFCHTQTDWWAELKLAALSHSYLVFKTAGFSDHF